MTKTRIAGIHFVMCALVGASALAPIGSALAWQPLAGQSRATVVAPPPSVRFQQNVQQQANRQLQQSQLQQQLNQNVSNNSRLPNASNTQAQQQADQADQARQARENAAQQDIIDRQRDANQLPRVVPQSQPAPSHSNG